MPARAVPLLVLGGTGRIGSALRDFWPFALKGGLRPIWQARDTRDLHLHWDILHDPEIGRASCRERVCLAV